MNQSVMKALKIVELFREGAQELSLKEISNQAKMPKPTAYRLLTTLEQNGYLNKTKETEHDVKYQLGLKFLELGNLVSDRLEVRGIALPYMEKLAKEINEVIHLVIVNQNEATYIEKVESSRALRLNTRIGRSVPLYIGSGPKLLLAFLTSERQETIINQSELISTHHPINKEQLKEEVKQIQKNGYAYSIGEQDEDTTGISYPIYNFQQKVVAALAVSGLSSHFEGINLELIKQETAKTAAEISQKLGYQSADQD
nr:IclR family transcriptional regulator [Priestia megaterium]